MIVEFSVAPIGQGESLGRAVAKVVDIIDKSGLPYKLTAMGTIVEGEWDDVFELIKECHAYARRSAGRVLTTITVDDRDGAKGRLEGKVEDVQSILGRRVKT
jgi:uncharacterized protein (TIGR00106 family)